MADEYLALSNPIDTPRQNEENAEKQPPAKPEEQGSVFSQLFGKLYPDFKEWFDSLEQKRKDYTEKISKQEEAVEETPETKEETADDSTRFVGTDVMRLFQREDSKSPVILTLSRGDKVEFTGKKVTSGNITWAQVKVGDEIGWVFANFLKKDKELTRTVDLGDYEFLKTAFNEYKNYNDCIGNIQEQPFGMQCVDLTRWFLNNYTTLTTDRGHGYEQAQATYDANKDKELSLSHIPSAPAVYSVAPNCEGPGLSNLSHETYGHTGIVLDVRVVSKPEGSTNPMEYTYAITYFHTYTNKKGINCDINTKNFIPSESVTYLNIGEYIK